LPSPWRPDRLEQGKRITDVELNIALESLEQLSGGRVYGGVHLQLAGARFPSGEWTDFVAVVLSLLCDGLAKVLAAPDEPVDVRFMEGAFAVRLGPIASSKIMVGLLDNTAASAVADSTEIHLESLMRTALKATRAVIDECRSRGFSSTDVEQLVASREQLVRAYGVATPG
jgi:hypothetical protein